MGIPAILAAAMKQISWGQVANIALQYGPDFIRKLQERLQTRPAAESEAAVTVEQLTERIRELESALIKQEEMIELQNKNIELLEEIGKTLQARLNIFMAVSAVSAVLTVVLGILLLRN
jgi:predicted ribosome quality control (RQC) complex YloA/Tae2 family protein